MSKGQKKAPEKKAAIRSKATLGLRVQVRNRLLPEEKIPMANIKIAHAEKKTDVNGTAIFDMLVDGDYVMTITPEPTSNDPVGPAIAEVVNPPKRIFRSFNATLTIKDKKLKSAKPSAL